MLKEKSNPWARAKYLYILPLAALAVTAFARPEVSAVADEISAVKVIAPAVHDSIQPMYSQQSQHPLRLWTRCLNFQVAWKR